MMNVLGMCFVVSSLAAAGVWSPSPDHKHNEGQDVIVIDGRRVVVIEYDKQGHHNTKVSISHQQGHGSHDHEAKPSSAATGVLENAKEKNKEASSSVIPNLSQESQNGASTDHMSHHGARELVCDAFGKCKHKIASAIGKAKEKAHKIEEGTKEAAGEAINKAEEDVAWKAHVVKEGAHAVEEGAKEAVEKAKHTAKEGARVVKEGAHAVEEGAKEAVEKAQHTAKTTLDTGKTIGLDAMTNVSKAAEAAREDVVEKAKEAKETAERVTGEVKTGARKLKEVVYDVLKHVVSPGTSLDSLMGVVNLLGFATAYGMCVWVTFVSSYVLAGALPRQQFGIVQNKIYPVYFRAMACSIGPALLGHLLSRRKHLFSRKAELFQCYNLVASLLMVFANLLFLEPRATKVMYERMKMEKEEGRGREGFIAEPSGAAEARPVVPENPELEVVRCRITRLHERLKKLNTYSSFLNILTLMALTWHLVYLGQRLHMTC